MKGFAQGHTERSRTGTGSFPVSAKAVTALFSRAAGKGRELLEDNTCWGGEGKVSQQNH